VIGRFWLLHHDDLTMMTSAAQFRSSNDGECGIFSDADRMDFIRESYVATGNWQVARWFAREWRAKRSHLSDARIENPTLAEIWFAFKKVTSIFEEP